MLNYKITSQGGNNDYKNLEVENISISGDTTIIVTCKRHGLRNGEIVRGVRYNYTDDIYGTFTVSVIDIDTFSLELETPYIAKYTDALFEDYDVGFNVNIDEISGDTYTVKQMPVLRLSFNDPHNFIYEKNFGDIVYEVNNDYYEGEGNKYTKKCNGDFILYNGLVYEYTGLTTRENFYIFPNDPYNSRNNHKVRLSYYNSVKNETVYIDNGFVMRDFSGSEDRYNVYFFYEHSNQTIEIDGVKYTSLVDDSETYEKLNYIFTNKPELTLYAVDDRFFVRNGDNVSFYYENGEQVSFLQKECGDYKLSLDIPLNVGYDLMKLESVKLDLFHDIISKNINPIIDYEKQRFEPVSYNGSVIDFKSDKFDDKNFKDINEVRFNIHLRERTSTKEGEWTSDETDLWNNYTMVLYENEKRFGPKHPEYEMSDSDLLYYAGFTDADIYYQRKKLKMSFLRLMFFDTPDPNTQTLQFYSTLFLDAGELYRKYIKARAILGDNEYVYYGITDEDTTFVKDEHLSDGNKDLRLSLSFSAKSMLDMDKCSEGFYLHLFPSLLEGKKKAELYMKAEFNHAGYGVTVPLTLPSKTNEYKEVLPIEIPIDGTNDFPVSYMKPNEDSENEYWGVDFTRLTNDTYTKIYIQKDDEKNRFVWFVPRKSNIDEDFIEFNLFEPRINGYENSYNKIKARIKNSEETIQHIKINVTLKNTPSQITQQVTTGDMTLVVSLNGIAIITVKTNSDKTTGDGFAVVKAGDIVGGRLTFTIMTNATIRCTNKVYVTKGETNKQILGYKEFKGSITRKYGPVDALFVNNWSYTEDDTTNIKFDVVNNDTSIVNGGIIDDSITIDEGNGDIIIPDDFTKNKKPSNNDSDLAVTWGSEEILH